jgi:hypothetical protein
MYIIDKNKNIETIQKLDLDRASFDELEGFDETFIEYKDEKLIATFVPKYVLGENAKDVAFINNSICIIDEKEILIESFKSIIETLECKREIL